MVTVRPDMKKDCFFYEVEGGNHFGFEDIDGNPLRSKQKKQKDISPTFVSWNRKALVSPRINTKQKNRILPIKKP